MAKSINLPALAEIRFYFIMRGVFHKNFANLPTEEIIKAIEENLLTKYPNRWLILYKLAMFYEEVGRYADSIILLGRCVELEPEELRSIFKLAFVYYRLTQAETNQDVAQAINRTFSIDDRRVKLDPNHAKSELKIMGLTSEEAGKNAIKYFRNALSLDPDDQGRAEIQSILNTLHDRFPTIPID